ncbi:bifunctional precorrin-2 dehydrogenase/sirohydrochlorin ferrochelatase [Sandarakinorhabdus limnophila]|jgi:uroporphyrin-III C-methyltransferase/precorrin-2 dehydrogenase/sirohydrochlorin ferrochelatase|uniref:precorrin-2 dehydrogenase/sirohydrochlorin ferrochelatase family protein n=1 Tax=Sandarakinorhabdus limnophila TaxID=210512 RepID=UPI0026EBCD70|nr:NAD(P)-dependent oxidoreductase [Sandarakinorhabdus limnophila]
MQQLPIFVNLAGRQVILVGDGEPAEAKARLVRAAGGELVGEHAAEAVLAFVAIEDDAEALAAATRLRARGLLVNVVDKPAMSDFLMGAIIDRSPVIVAISTAGASASLARALRTRFEALLPASLGPLARAILAARDAVAARHPTPNDRRRLWERALAQAGPLDPFAALPDADAAVSRVIEGSSTATPQLREIAITSDDPGDLTLNQLNALARCDALVVVGAVVPAIIDRARRDAARLDAVPDPLPAGLTVVLRDEA